ncbi:MAG: pseudouridine synthase [Eubacteriales bacterium]|nr:pseudouridine synthase [Eubacteriales bacterium]
MRLDKALSLAGHTRSEARRLIAQGRVQVSGAVVRDAGRNVSSGDVMLDGAPIDAQEEIYLMLHKPAGVVTATEDKYLPTVVSLLPEIYQRRKIGPVGRLDRDVTGLVLLTTDGQLAHRLISPRWKAEKCYRARCEGALDANDVAAFAGGLMLSDFTAAPARLEILESGETSLADVILTEGKFHQVKRMFAAVGHPLITLQRLRIGCVTLDEALAPGEYRLLTEAEIAGLKKMSDMDGGCI